MLVVAQFAVSIGLIICTAIVYAQTSYARNVDAGYKRDGLLQLDGIGRPQAEQVADALMQQVRRIPGVVAVGRYVEACKNRSEEHTSELQSLMRTSYAVFCLKKKKDQLLMKHTTQS